MIMRRLRTWFVLLERRIRITIPCFEGVTVTSKRAVPLPSCERLVRAASQSTSTVPSPSNRTV